MREVSSVLDIEYAGRRPLKASGESISLHLCIQSQHCGKAVINPHSSVSVQTTLSVWELSVESHHVASATQ